MHSPHAPHVFAFSLAQEHVAMWIEQLLVPTADGVGSENLSFNVKQKLWTRAFVLALLRTRLDFFHGGMEGDEKLEIQGQVST